MGVHRWYLPTAHPGLTSTIGDSFMCATPSPVQAVHFALALQRRFYTHDWGTTAIDDVYRGLGCDDGEAWNGLLRVRPLDLRKSWCGCCRRTEVERQQRQ